MAPVCFSGRHELFVGSRRRAVAASVPRVTGFTESSEGRSVAPDRRRGRRPPLMNPFAVCSSERSPVAHCGL